MPDAQTEFDALTAAAPPDTRNLQLKLGIIATLSDPQAKNPCILRYGPGPAGARCKTCQKLFTSQPGRQKFFKCRERSYTHGPATDHRANWPACAAYVPAEVPLLTRKPRKPKTP